MLAHAYRVCVQLELERKLTELEQQAAQLNVSFHVVLFHET